MNDTSDNITGSAPKRATYKGCKHNNDSPGARVISGHSWLRSTALVIVFLTSETHQTTGRQHNRRNIGRTSCDSQVRVRTWRALAFMTRKPRSVCMKFITLTNLPRVFTWEVKQFLSSLRSNPDSELWFMDNSEVSALLSWWHRLPSHVLVRFTLQAPWRMDISFRCRCIDEQSERDRHISQWKTLRRDRQSQWHRDHMLSSWPANHFMTLIENAAITC